MFNRRDLSTLSFHACILYGLMQRRSFRPRKKSISPKQQYYTKIVFGCQGLREKICKEIMLGEKKKKVVIRSNPILELEDLPSKTLVGLCQLKKCEIYRTGSVPHAYAL